MDNSVGPSQPQQGELGLRKTKDGPWCWLSKAAIDRIRERFDSANVVSTALAVYLALTEIASDNGFDTFDTRHLWISQKCGVGVSTIKKRLTGLEEIGLIKVKTPPLKAPCTYQLLAVTDSQPSTNVSQPSTNVSQPSTNVSQPSTNVSQTTQKSLGPQPLATSEEKEEMKESKESENKERGARPKKGSSFSPPTIEEAKSYAITIDLAPTEVEAFHDHFTSNGWRIGGKAPMKDWQSAMRQWKRRGNTFGRNGTPNRTKPNQTQGGW